MEMDTNNNKARIRVVFIQVGFEVKKRIVSVVVRKETGS